VVERYDDGGVALGEELLSDRASQWGRGSMSGILNIDNEHHQKKTKSQEEDSRHFGELLTGSKLFLAGQKQCDFGGERLRAPQESLLG
jgi:hypothetical protein